MLKLCIFYLNRIFYTCSIEIHISDQLDEASCDGCLENLPSSSAPHINIDNIDSHIEMESNSITNMYNFYNAYVRRTSFEITTMCDRSHNKKETCFKHQTYWREERSGCHFSLPLQNRWWTKRPS